jgi:hypothetical protein
MKGTGSRSIKERESQNPAVLDAPPEKRRRQTASERSFVKLEFLEKLR